MWCLDVCVCAMREATGLARGRGLWRGGTSEQLIERGEKAGGASLVSTHHRAVHPKTHLAVTDGHELLDGLCAQLPRPRHLRLQLLTLLWRWMDGWMDGWMVWCGGCCCGG